ncbi:MAG: AbrB/MazE/SpoVT family DNA-binding domain-containing protein [Nevskia sp.]|nr:AbrB/MazE/SpoVT family DNA-binding domain-containing protein [Nevskia sp.]
MRAKAARWGNSIGVRIPAALAGEVGLVPGSEVQVIVAGGALKLVPVHPQRYSLRQLLKGIKPDNLHGETPAGGAVGAEVIE